MNYLANDTYAAHITMLMHEKKREYKIFKTK